MTEYRWRGPDNFTWELIAPDGRTYAFAADLQERLADSMDALNELWDEFEVLESKLGDAEEVNNELEVQVEDLEVKLVDANDLKIAQGQKIANLRTGMESRDREIEGLRNLVSELQVQIVIMTFDADQNPLLVRLRNQIQDLKSQLGIS